MGKAYRLVKAMQTAAAPKENDVVDIVVGTVTSVSPLTIKTDRLTLTKSFLILSGLCQEKKIRIPVATGNNDNPTTLTDVVLWRGLRQGDQVNMIRCCNGQKYYVLQRKEGV